MPGHENHEHEDEVIVLTDENGEEHEFTILDVLEVDGKDYAVLLPPGDEDDDEAVILRIETDEKGEDVLVDIEDDAEFERVAEAWEELLDEDEFDAQAGDDDEQ